MYKSLILYSGGADSTLSAALHAEKGYNVHLITLDRFSYVKVQEYTSHNYHKLVAIYGANCFSRTILPIEAWHKYLNYERYFYFFRKYKLAIVSMIFSKLALHWRALVYALQNQIKCVADGAVPYMGPYPDQNAHIGGEQFASLYQYFGIKYENPVWEIADDVEQLLYDRGITSTPSIRGSSEDRQVFYAEQFVFALFVKYYKMKFGPSQYEDTMANIYTEKIRLIKMLTEEWLTGEKNIITTFLG